MLLLRNYYRCCFILLLLLSGRASAEWYQDVQAIMGTEVRVELWAENPTRANRLIAEVMADMRRIDAQFSPYKPSSELSRVNASAAQSPVPLSEELYTLIQKSLFYSQLSGGAFDISFASVGRWYDYREAKKPDAATLESTVEAIDYQGIVLDPEHKTVWFKHPQLKIDLGGIAKGHAVDRAINYLAGEGLSSAIVSAGGDSRILGERRGTPWLIGVRHPRKAGEFAVKIPVVDSAVSTSGDYERFFIEDGQRYHHILNPTTGGSATGVQSVTVLADLSVDADALSTTVFVLGVKEGLALINRLPGIDAFIIDGQGKLHYSDGLLQQTSANN